jgi:hypothetical protein
MIFIYMNIISKLNDFLQILILTIIIYLDKLLQKLIVISLIIL